MDERVALIQWAGEWLGNQLTARFAQVRTPFDVRTQMIHAIIREISTLLPEDYETIDELREMLILASQTATSQLLEDLAKRDPIPAEEVMKEEREGFCQALRAVDRKQLKARQPLPPMPFARELSQGEAADLWERVARKWELKHNHWYPIYGPPRPANALAFLAEMFEANVTPTKLRSILRDHGVERFFLFSEFSPIGIQGGLPELEMALELLEPRYGQAAGGEGYWFSIEMDWLIYASHESSITVGGEWLVEAVKHTWPDWEDALYEKYPIARFHLGDYKPDT